MKRITNPWRTVPESAPFILSEDAPYVEALNGTLRKDDRAHRIIDDLPPSPFAGLHKAPVVVLLANPGWSKSDRKEQCAPSALPTILDASRSVGGAPVWALGEQFKTTSAGRWWRSRTKDLEKVAGGYEALSKQLLLVELHGYHSREWTSPLATFPSQWFGFQLVSDAMNRGAVIVITRCRRHWFAAVPGLQQYERCVGRLSSTRSAYLSRKNLGKSFDVVVDTLRSG